MGDMYGRYIWEVYIWGIYVWEVYMGGIYVWDIWNVDVKIGRICYS